MIKMPIIKINKITTNSYKPYSPLRPTIPVPNNSLKINHNMEEVYQNALISVIMGMTKPKNEKEFPCEYVKSHSGFNHTIEKVPANSFIIRLYSDDGKLKHKLNYKNNQLYGPSIAYDASGNIDWRGSFVRGKPNPYIMLYRYNSPYLLKKMW